MEQLTTKVNTIIGDQLGVEDGSLVPEANLLDDLGADSLDVVELVMALEEEFSIEVPDEDVENIRTIGDIVQYIGTRVGASA
jgi:acyl carrier protein